MTIWTRTHTHTKTRWLTHALPSWTLLSGSISSQHTVWVGRLQVGCWGGWSVSLYWSSPPSQSNGFSRPQNTCCVCAWPVTTPICSQVRCRWLGACLDMIGLCERYILVLWPITQTPTSSNASKRQKPWVSRTTSPQSQWKSVRIL